MCSVSQCSTPVYQNVTLTNAIIIAGTTGSTAATTGTTGKTDTGVSLLLLVFIQCFLKIFIYHEAIYLFAHLLSLATSFRIPNFSKHDLSDPMTKTWHILMKMTEITKMAILYPQMTPGGEK